MSIRGTRRRRRSRREVDKATLSPSSFEDLYHLNGASALEGVWERFKLKEVISDPSFLGKTIRLGDSIFEVKGLDEPIAGERRKKEWGKNHPGESVVL